MVLYKIIQYGLISMVILFICYQLVLVGLAFFSKKHESLTTAYDRSFLIIVPCHNMGQVLSKTLYSLSGLIYPSNLYKVVVLADNCTDDTVGVAQKFGLKVLERHYDQQLDGSSSIEWALGQIRQWDEKYDAITVINTGSLISSNFLQVMNYYVEEGSEVIQSSNLLLGSPGRSRNEMVQFIRLLYNYINLLGHKALGFNMYLSGNGMCFKTSILMKYPLRHNSKDEVWEYSLLLGLKEIPIEFVPEAQVWTPLQSISSKRKLSYIFSNNLGHSIINKYTKPFLIHILTKRPRLIVKTLLSFMTLPVAKLIVGILAVLVINVVLWKFGLISILFVWAWLVLAIMEGIYIYTGIVVGRVMFNKLNGK